MPWEIFLADEVERWLDDTAVPRAEHLYAVYLKERAEEELEGRP